MNELGGERRPDASEQSERRGLVVTVHLPYQGITLDEVLERPLILPEIRERFGEREMEIDLQFFANRSAFQRQLLHGGKMRIAAREMFDLREQTIIFGFGRRQFDRLLDGFLSLVQATEFLQSAPHTSVRACMVWLDR